MSDSKHQNIALVFIGDSDIARWPDDLYPSPSTKASLGHHHITSTVINHAKGGASMKHLREQIALSMKQLSGKHYDAIIFIACAGENDISNGMDIDEIMKSFEKAANILFSPTMIATSHQIHFIFIGPKVEPWMEDGELEARKGYFQLSERLNQAREKISASIWSWDDGDGDQSISSRLCGVGGVGGGDGRSIHYIDALTMFCGDTNSRSVCAGKAVAERIYFDEDGLHLSNEGYELLRKEVESVLEHIICGESCLDSLDNSHRHSMHSYSYSKISVSKKPSASQKYSKRYQSLCYLFGFLRHLKFYSIAALR